MKVIKKDGRPEEFNKSKILDAIQKSALRVNFNLTEKHKQQVLKHISNSIDIRGCQELYVYDLHSLVEGALMEIVPKVGKSYAEYRNYKAESLAMYNSILGEEADLRLNGDKNNANTLSYLIPVIRSLTYKIYAKKMYQNFFLTVNERNHIKDGIIYIHDIGDRTMQRHGIINCCLADVETIMKNGFELCGVKYSEPKTLPTAFNVFMIILNSMAASQYGGYTVESIDTLFAYYAEKSYNLHYADYMNISSDIIRELSDNENENFHTRFSTEADKYAMGKVDKEIRQGVQNITYSLSSAVSARGDFPFVTTSFGLGKSKFETLISKIILEDRMTGMGPGKIPAMFPKLIFLYDNKLHEPNSELYWLFQQAIKCQSQTMLPDFLSLTGEGYVPEMYKKYDRTISPMGKW